MEDDLKQFENGRRPKFFLNEDDLNFLKNEDDLKKMKMEDDFKKFENGRQPHKI